MHGMRDAARAHHRGRAVIPTPTTPPGHLVHTFAVGSSLVLICECGTWRTHAPNGTDTDELNMRTAAHHAVVRGYLTGAPA
jgi:hypothetical protein